MEAKTWQETVLTEKQLKEKISPTITIGEQAQKSLELQAEISWKARDAEIVERQRQYAKRIKELQEACTKWWSG